MDRIGDILEKWIIQLDLQEQIIMTKIMVWLNLGELYWDVLSTSFS